MYKASLVENILGDGDCLWECSFSGKRDVEAFLAWLTKQCKWRYTRRTMLSGTEYTIDYGSHSLFIKVIEIDPLKD